MSLATIIGASLPPMVEGQLRCFLSIKVGELVWDIARPPKDIQVRIIWWGQTGNGAVLRPHVHTDPNYVVSTNKHDEVHYPVRCGPRQFEAYLQDMSSLHLDVIFGPSSTNFAVINVMDIAKLSSTQVLDSYYPLISTTPAFKDKQVGQLQLCASFKSISDTYNISSSIIPTTDKEFQQPEIVGKKHKGAKSKLETGKQQQKKITSKNTHALVSNKPDTKFETESSIPDHLTEDVDFIVGPGASLPHYSQREKKEKKKSKVRISVDNSDEEDSDKDVLEPFVTRKTDNICLPGTPSPEEDLVRDKPIILKGEKRAAVLSSLLQKTEKLRDSMMKHTLGSDDMPLNSEVCATKSSGGLIDTLLKDMKLEGTPLDTSDTETLTGDVATHEMAKIDTRVVDLLLGKEDNISQLLRKVDMSMDSNLSDYSDDQDPLHDSSLMDELLYTTKAVQNIDESSILSLNESNDEDLNIEEAKKNMKLNKVLPLVDCDLIPTKENEDSLNVDEMDVGEDDNFGSTSTPLLKGLEEQRLLHDCVTVEKLTQLGRVKSVKVILMELSLTTESLDYGCIYFVEYRFPVSTEENKNVLMEQVRHVSRHVNNVVEFGRISVFPIIFNEEMVEFWWDKSITFTLYVKYERQGKPEWFGEGYFKLRDILLNDGMKINGDIDIYNDVHGDHRSFSPIGQLKLYVELSVEHSRVLESHRNNKTKLPSIVSIPIEKIEEQAMPSYPLTPIKINTRNTKGAIRGTDKKLVAGTSENLSKQQPDVCENMFLHNLIVVSSGRDIVYSTKSDDECSFCNSYFICRVFWNNGELKSKICWSTSNPNYGFQQIIPVNLTTNAMSKMENNFMIIEVWHKTTTVDKDKLIGMSKLPLHQFFLSFKDAGLAETILKSKYPVIANDGPVPVMNLISGKSHGSLNVIFALGTHDQVTEVLQMKRVYSPKRVLKEECETVNNNKGNRDIQEGYSDHCFEVTIKNIMGLVQDRDEVWGEADCYIQYHFPEQKKMSNEIKMSMFMTKTTLCLPNPVFHHMSTHSFYLKSNVPLQKLLLEHFQGKSAVMVFEMWKRHYYPNIRDQFIAKASLPVAKICAMVAMHGGKDSDQCFHLPLVSHTVSNDTEKGNNCILDVAIAYKFSTSRGSSNDPHIDVHLPKELVCLSVSLNRLCGLKDGLCQLSKKYRKLDHAARTGPNIFVKMYLSFIGKASIKITNVAAKSFSPSFSYHVDFPLPIKLGEGSETSLAELLEDGFIMCDVVHEFVEADIEDIVICVAKIPLLDLLTHSTGIKGWWPLVLANSDEEDRENCIAGGIEVNAKFTNEIDREKIINIAYGMGWSPRSDLSLHDEAWRLSPNDYECKPSLLNIYVDFIQIPANVIDNLLCKHTGMKHHFEAVYCRYKFFNKSPIYSKPAKLGGKGEKHHCALSHVSSHEIIPSTSFAWYLREEKLEIQFWLSWSNVRATDSSITREKDKLIGSAYVDMSSFSHSPYEEKVVSHHFSMFNANSDSICNATARISITFNKNIGKNMSQSVPLHQDVNLAATGSSSDDDEDDLLNDICQKPIKEVDEGESDDENCEKVKILIEEALHLPQTNPKIYITYQLPNTSLVYTNVSSNGNKHKWNFQKQHKINAESLKGMNLIFHMWKCSSEKQNVDRDILIGTSEVDTGPLFVGMKHIIGWYNIQDLNRQIIGQIKLGIIPTTSLSSPASSKYFQSNVQIQPINIGKIQFSNPSFTMSSKTAIQEKSVTTEKDLFQQLNSQLDDLHELTSHIQQRVYKIPQSQTYIKRGEHSDMLTENEVPEQTIEHSDNYHFNDNHDDVQSMHSDAFVCDSDIKECLEISTDEIIENQDIVDEALMALQMTEDLHGLSTEKASVYVSDEDISPREDHLEEHFEERIIENVDKNSSCGSTDELLVDLKKFEEKFALVKDSFEKDNNCEHDSWLSDPDIIIDIHLANAQEDEDAASSHHNEQMPDVNNMIETCITSHMGNNCFENEIDEDIEFDVNKIDIDIAESASQKSNDIGEEDDELSFNQYSAPLLPMKTLDHDYQNTKHELLDEENENTRNGLTVEEDDQFFIPDGERSSSNSEEKSPNIMPNFEVRSNVELPNFFMGAEELAESMHALRMNAKLRQSPRMRSSYSGEEAEHVANLRDKIKDNRNVMRDTDKELKEKIRKTLPVEVSEMARIASIFSLKSKTK